MTLHWQTNHFLISQSNSWYILHSSVNKGILSLLTTCGIFNAKQRTALVPASDFLSIGCKHVRSRRSLPKGRSVWRYLVTVNEISHIKDNFLISRRCSCCWSIFDFVRESRVDFPTSMFFLDNRLSSLHTSTSSSFFPLTYSSTFFLRNISTPDFINSDISSNNRWISSSSLWKSVRKLGRENQHWAENLSELRLN